MRPAHALIDGNKAPKDLPCTAQTIVKGDGKSLSIAAASIIAKVARDRFMKEIAAAFPDYGWDRNAGYPTAEHLAALQKWGPTPWHRVSFAPVSEQIRVNK
jgi:ribonuclease HII